MRILVTGSRDWDKWDILAYALMDASRGVPGEDITVIHGGAPGADTMAGLEADAWGMHVEVHRAEWGKYGPAAGPKRNQEMVDAGADLCLAFLKTGAANRGTKDCIGRAEAAGIPVRRIWSDGEGGVHEPRGDSPNSPALAAAGVPGATG